jgi:hypothetical protein
MDGGGNEVLSVAIGVGHKRRAVVGVRVLVKSDWRRRGRHFGEPALLLLRALLLAAFRTCGGGRRAVCSGLEDDWRVVIAVRGGAFCEQEELGRRQVVGRGRHMSSRGGDITVHADEGEGARVVVVVVIRSVGGDVWIGGGGGHKAGAQVSS